MHLRLFKTAIPSRTTHDLKLNLFRISDHAQPASRFFTQTSEKSYCVTSLMESPSKRRRIAKEEDEPPSHRLASLERPISPPRMRKASRSPKMVVEEPAPENITPEASPAQPVPNDSVHEHTSATGTVESPFHLTHIRDLPDELNRDAVTLHDLLKDPLISHCWEFNYLHDIPFLMSHFDNDTRHLVKVHVVHGFWKRDDPNQAALKEDAAQFDNVKLHTAYMPEMFGTHHSKMLILFRHDETAQVIIHTANMIAKDWTNMTNGVWKSPLLPLLPEGHEERTFAKLEASARDHAAVGSGSKFKLDLMWYINAYNARRPILQELADRLVQHDFSSIRAALIASVPGRHHIHDKSRTAWGWPALADVLRHVPAQGGRSRVAVQISSIATLGATDSWLQKCLFEPLGLSKGSIKEKPTFKVVFPTADEIRRSLDGYASGGSIHTKIQSAQQAKQLRYLQPIFCHWANDSADGKGLPKDTDIQNSGRQRAAPHIKTYIRYGDKSIDWALLTSANVSKQAWGEAANVSKEVRICSWEIGVLVWPALLTNDDKAMMVGAFGTDTPPTDDSHASPVVGLRIPYSLPLQEYSAGEIPWVATMAHAEPDCFGRAYGLDD